MIFYTEKQKKYWDKWPLKRTNKWYYVVKNGLLWYTILMLVLLFLFDKRTYHGEIELREILIKIAVWSVAGLVSSYSGYFNNEKGYKKYVSIVMNNLIF